MSIREERAGFDNPAVKTDTTIPECIFSDTRNIYGADGDRELPPAMAYLNPSSSQQEVAKGHITRRSILKCAGLAALSMVILERAGTEIAGLFEQDNYGNNAAEFTIGTPELPQTGGNEIILFGGLGESDTTDYAVGLGKKEHTPTRTVGLRYPAQGFQIEEIAGALYDHLRKARPEKVALDLTSMGTQIGLQAYGLVIKNKRELEKQWAISHGTRPDYDWKIPPISLIAANGAPASIEDASMKDVAKLLLKLHEITGYTPGIDVKTLYECLDDQDGWQKTFGLEGPKEMVGQWVNGYRRAAKVPDELLISQLIILANSNNEQTFENLRYCAGAYTTLCYFIAKNWRDNVVGEKGASAKIIKAAKSIDVKKFKIVSTELPYHASRWGADNYLPAIIDEAFGYTDKYFERLNNKTNPDIRA